MATDGCNHASSFVDVGMELELIIALAATGINHACEVILEEPTEAKVGSLAKGDGRLQRWPWGARTRSNNCRLQPGPCHDKRKNTLVYHGNGVVCPPTCTQRTEPRHCEESTCKRCTMTRSNGHRTLVDPCSDNSPYKLPYSDAEHVTQNSWYGLRTCATYSHVVTNGVMGAMAQERATLNLGNATCWSELLVIHKCHNCPTSGNERTMCFMKGRTLYSEH
jgi:hypothetical protein